MDNYVETHKKKKKKVRYSYIRVSDSACQEIEYIRDTPKFYQGAGIFLVLLLLVLGIFSAYAGTLIAAETKEKERLQKQVAVLSEEKDQLTKQAEELNGKVAILSDTVNQKVEQEAAAAAEQEEKSLPKGFPLGGAATMEEQTEPATPIAVFIANQGITVIASGNGAVLSVGDDPEYGHSIQVDHGNGYVSIYRSEADVKVSQGDQVERGTVLYEMNSNEQKLGYQIQLNGEYVQPMDLLEIYG